jgi:hypothetical protein
VTESQKDRYRSDADYREKQKRASKEYYEKHRDDPEFRKKRNEASLAWAKRNRTQASQNVAQRQKERYQRDPEYRAKIRQRQKDKYNSDPEFQARRIQAHKDYAERLGPVYLERTRMSAKKRLDKAWDEVLAVYGRICTCCGESNPAFLTLHHKIGSADEDRMRLLGRSTCHSNMYSGYLRKVAEQADHERYEILCYNCNCGTSHRGNGVCPHKIAP